MNKPKKFKDLQPGDKLYSYTQDEIIVFVVTSTEIVKTQHFYGSPEKCLNIKYKNPNTLEEYTLLINESYQWYKTHLESNCFDSKFGLSITATDVDVIYNYLRENYEKEVKSKEQMMKNYEYSIKRAKDQLENFEQIIKEKQ